jgi:hypothetical protein
MTDTIKYTCSCCGKEHFEYPSLAYISPTHYDILSQEDKENIAELSSDFCVINHEDQTDRFIRCILLQKIVDHCQDLNYGLWVSLSENSYKDYSENYYNENHETRYFGWLCNDLPDYDFKESIPTTVYTKTGNQRPEIVPHQDFDHPFVRDYYNGITKQEAERRINNMLVSTGQKSNLIDNKKPWWKLW